MFNFVLSIAQDRHNSLKQCLCWIALWSYFLVFTAFLHAFVPLIRNKKWNCQWKPEKGATPIFYHIQQENIVFINILEREKMKTLIFISYDN